MKLHLKSFRLLALAASLNLTQSSIICFEDNQPSEQQITSENIQEIRALFKNITQSTEQNLKKIQKNSKELLIKGLGKFRKLVDELDDAVKNNNRTAKKVLSPTEIVAILENNKPTIKEQPNIPETQIQEQEKSNQE